MRLGCVHANAGLQNLVCVSIPGCTGIKASGLQPLTSLPALRALSIAACPQLGDASGVGWVLARLPSLQLLQADSSGLGDDSLAALCYGWRLRAWAAESGDHGNEIKPPPPPPPPPPRGGQELCNAIWTVAVIIWQGAWLRHLVACRMAKDAVVIENQENVYNGFGAS